MFASYLGDVEQLLDQKRWERALREACDLPRLAVALADPQLRYQAEQVQRWCQEWIRPPGAERDAHGMDFEPLLQRLIERIMQRPVAEMVPMRALRRLQLSRHVRTLPRGFLAARAETLAPAQAEVVQMSVALIEAARRWYARTACHDPVVQDNLARLAVLR